MSSLPRRALLPALCGLPAFVEALVVLLTGPNVARVLAPQTTALPVLGVFHDLRWLLVYADSPLWTAVGVAVILLGRATLSTACLLLAWPEGDRPPAAALWRANLVAGLVGVVLLAPAAAMLVGVALLPFSWPYLAAAPLALMIAAVLAHAGLSTHWWGGLPRPRAVGVLAAQAVWLTAASAALALLPPEAGPVVAGVAGTANALAWRAAAGSLPAPRNLRTVPVAPLAVVVLVGACYTGAWASFSAQTHRQHLSADLNTGWGGRPVLVVAGFGSDCCGRDRGLADHDPRLTVRQFSYAGLDAHGRPIPHGRAATDQPLDVLAARLRRQVDLMHARTGRPVTLVAESEGSLVTAAYLTHHPDAPVDAVLLLSPVSGPGRATFPSPASTVPGGRPAGCCAGSSAPSTRSPRSMSRSTGGCWRRWLRTRGRSPPGSAARSSGPGSSRWRTR